MKPYIVDVGLQGLDSLVEQLKKGDLDICAVIISCDVSNYNDLAALAINKIREVSDVKVYLGAQRPMLDKTFSDKFILPQQTTQHEFEKLHGANFLIETIKNNHETGVICLGPLTNIALAIMKDYDTVSKIKNMYIAGGSLLGYQSTTPVAHHNILADVEAADAVFKTDIPLTLIPVNVAQNLEQTTFDIVKGAAFENWQAFITVDTGLGFTRGQTVIDLVGRNPINGDITPGVKKTVVTKIKEEK